MALEETRGLIFNVEKQQMDNHTAVGLPSQAYHISTAGKCSQESSEMCMFGSQVNEHRTAVHFFPPPRSQPGQLPGTGSSARGSAPVQALVGSLHWRGSTEGITPGNGD